MPYDEALFGGQNLVKKKKASFQEPNQNSDFCIFFGNSTPKVKIQDTPINFDLSDCQFEQAILKDHLFAYDFMEQNIMTPEKTGDRYSAEQLKTLGWLVSLDTDKLQ